MKKTLSSVLMLTVLLCGNAFAQTKTKTTIKPPPPAPKITTAPAPKIATPAPAPKVVAPAPKVVTPAPVQRPAAPAPAPKVAAPAPKVTSAKPVVAPKPVAVKPVVPKAAKTTVKKKTTAAKKTTKKKKVAEEPGIYTGGMPEPVQPQNYNITQHHNGPSIVEIKNGRVTVNDEEVARLNDVKRDCIRISIDNVTPEPTLVIEPKKEKECKPRCCHYNHHCGHRCGGIPTWKCKSESCKDEDRRRELFKDNRWRP